jgi:hypothetical protein
MRFHGSTSWNNGCCWQCCMSGTCLAHEAASSSASARSTSHFTYLHAQTTPVFRLPGRPRPTQIKGLRGEKPSCAGAAEQEREHGAAFACDAAWRRGARRPGGRGKSRGNNARGRGSLRDVTEQDRRLFSSSLSIEIWWLKTYYDGKTLC